MQTPVVFHKMHGLGNDFVVIDAVTQDVTLNQAQIQKLADRRFGIGCDQVLLIEPPKQPDVDFTYRIFNQDGSEVAQCGNGARCVGYLLQQQQLSVKHPIVLATQSSRLTVYVKQNGLVDVDMGAPQFTPNEIPFVCTRTSQNSHYTFNRDGRDHLGVVLSMGNPHVVFCVEDINTVDIQGWGQALNADSRFPEGVNVGFMQQLAAGRLALRVFERGVGETQACGSGACAAAVAARQLQLMNDEKVDVQQPGGTLSIRWPGGSHSVRLCAEAKAVFTGNIVL